MPEVQVGCDSGSVARVDQLNVIRACDMMSMILLVVVLSRSFYVALTPSPYQSEKSNGSSCQELIRFPGIAGVKGAFNGHTWDASWNNLRTPSVRVLSVAPASNEFNRDSNIERSRWANYHEIFAFSNLDRSSEIRIFQEKSDQRDVVDRGSNDRVLDRYCKFLDTRQNVVLIF
jgi:hypothetical protein